MFHPRILMTVDRLRSISLIQTTFFVPIGAGVMAKRKPYDGPCPIERIIGVFGGKWKPAIMFHLEREGTLRFSELKRLIPEVTQRMLTQQLRELERDGLLKREQFAEIPPRVEYTALISLGPVAKAIEKWGSQHMATVKKSRRAYDRKHEE